MAAAPDLKITVLGVNGAGKSALVSRFVNDLVPETLDPTISGIYYKTFVDRSGRDKLIALFDTADEECSQFGPDPFDCDAFIVVYNLCDRSSFLAVPSILHKIRKPTIVRHIVVIATHLDQAETGREVEFEEGLKTSIGAFHEVSSTESVNVKEALGELISHALYYRTRDLNADLGDANSSVADEKKNGPCSIQ